MNRSLKKHAKFGELIAEVRQCVRCARMCNSARVLNYSAGNLNAKLMFIGEAPGRLGADATEVPFHGDKAGRNFEDLLAVAGINRVETFITNAVLCNPKGNDGNNEPPSRNEALNCQSFLRRQIELVNPTIVVSLGHTALRSLAGISEHSLDLSKDVGTISEWFGRFLIPLYHPGQRAMIRRPLKEQICDYEFVAEQMKAFAQKTNEPGRSDVLAIAHYLLARRGELSYFELHKFAYLAEYVHVRRSGRRLTKAYFIRQKDGPYCTDLEINRFRKADGAVRVLKRGNALYLRLRPDRSPELFTEASTISEKAKAAADETLQRYGDKQDAELKTAVYLTAPMRFILRQERSTKKSFLNAPIDFLAAALA